MTILNSVFDEKTKSVIHEYENDIVIIDNAITTEQQEALHKFFENKIESFGKIHSTTPTIESYYSDKKDRPIALYVDRQRDKELDSFCFDIFNQLAKLFITYQNDTHAAIVPIAGDTGYRLSIYDKEHSSYKFHTDAGHTNKNRMISAIICLNSNYDGGALHFPKFKQKFKLGERQCVLFPSGYTHPHEVLPVTKGERKTLMTWFI